MEPANKEPANKEPVGVMGAKPPQTVFHTILTA